MIITYYYDYIRNIMIIKYYYDYIRNIMIITYYNDYNIQLWTVYKISIKIYNNGQTITKNPITCKQATVRYYYKLSYRFSNLNKRKQIKNTLKSNKEASIRKSEVDSFCMKMKKVVFH